MCVQHHLMCAILHVLLTLRSNFCLVICTSIFFTVLLCAHRAAINDSSVLNVTKYGGKWGLDVGGIPPEDHGTTHFNVVCPKRMAVSFTSTVNGGFGSKVFSKSTGVVNLPFPTFLSLMHS